MTVDRVPIPAWRGVLEHILLSPETLLDRNWIPSTPVSEFLRKRMRPTVYFLQRASCDGNGFEGMPVVVPPDEQEEIRGYLQLILGALRQVRRARYRMAESVRAGSPLHPDISYFRIPPQATRLFEIVLLLASRFPPAMEAQHLAYFMMLPQVLGMVAISKLAATASACGQDYPEYDSRGLLAEFDGEFNFPVIPAHLPE
ncbi:hypothetical protein FB451DRAFT_1387883 [Mycena latifolia]|nr:hypothetical protein FB451DRAFT_1387883 [Mycena latifolia]